VDKSGFPKMIAPSILSADFAHLADEILSVEKAGADIIHIDVMDGHFVPNITLGAPVVKKIRDVTSLPLDCHLMIEEPHRYIADFLDAGASMISVHVETSKARHSIRLIKKAGLKAGIVINPPTSLRSIMPYLELVDFVLVMTVNPGFGGQKMIEGCLKKVSDLYELREKNRLEFLIEVDGGINLENISRVKAAGADIFVAGAAIFKNPPYRNVIRKMKKIIRS